MIAFCLADVAAIPAPLIVVAAVADWSLTGWLTHTTHTLILLAPWFATVALVTMGVVSVARNVLLGRSTVRALVLVVGEVFYRWGPRHSGRGLCRRNSGESSGVAL